MQGMLVNSKVTLVIKRVKGQSSSTIVQQSNWYIKQQILSSMLPVALA